MKLTSAILLALANAENYEVFLRGGEDKIYTWREAKNYCQSLHNGWQLVVIDSATKNEAVVEAFKKAGAGTDDAAWIGYENDDGWSHNTANTAKTIDVYGNRASFTNYALHEPNNKYGSPSDERGEDCVKMRLDGTWEDALCGRKHTKKNKKGQKGIFNSFICEPKPLDKNNGCIPMSAPPTDDNYHVEGASTISFNDARAACQARGAQWDLAVFESAEELSFVNRMINCLPEAFWIGFREHNGKAMTIFNKPSTIQIPWEINKSNGEPDEPNGADEECVRMRYGRMNDAKCTHTWTGAMRDNLGMGYVCEKHTHLKPTQPPITTPGKRESTCQENDWGVEEFKVKRGCPSPIYCEAGLEILDAWTRVDKGSGKKRYGIAAKINLSPVLYSKSRGKGYSVLLRFPKELTRASFQVWNVNFFNFYNGGTEVLLHSKYWTPNNQGFDPESASFIIIADNMDIKAHPTVLSFAGRVSQHSCFDPSMHMGQRAGFGFGGDSAVRSMAQDKYDDVTLDNVQKITMSRGQLKKVRAVGALRRL